MSNTYDQWIGGGAGGAIQAGDPYRPAEGDRIRQNFNVLAYLGSHISLGGDERPIITDTEPADGIADWRPLNGAWTITLNVNDLGGLTLDVVFHYYTTNGATSVQMRVRNLSDSSNAALGAVSTSTTMVTETVTLTLASGAKNYQGQLIGGNVTNGVYGWGYIRPRLVPV